MNLTQQPIVVSETTTHFEFNGYMHYLIVPAGHTDPRLSLIESRCDGGALSRLSIGDEGISGSYRGSPIYDTPAGQVTEITTTDFTVLAGPECVDGQAWWQVQDTSQELGRIGWIAENEDSRYLILPDFPPISLTTAS